MRVVVTQTHIDNGKKFQTQRCPIALALRELGYRATVGSKIAEINGCYAELPQAASGFITMFDAGLPVAPFEFDI